MDLVGVIAACALGFDASLMHALVWNESRGNPWSVRTQVTGEARVYRTRSEAVGEALRARAGRTAIRVGLAGVPLAPERADAQAISELIQPCANIRTAASRLAALQERCARELRFGPETARCTLALWRGALTTQGFAFADTVRADAAAGRLPNFDLDNQPDPQPDASARNAGPRPDRTPDSDRGDLRHRDDAPADDAGERTPSETDQARRAPLFVPPADVAGAGRRASDHSSPTASAVAGPAGEPYRRGALVPSRSPAVGAAAEPSPSRMPGAGRDPAESPSPRAPAADAPRRERPPATVFVPATRERGQP